MEQTERFEELAQLHAGYADRAETPEERAEHLVSSSAILHDKLADHDGALRLLLEALWELPTNDRVAERIESIARAHDRWTPILDAINAWAVHPALDHDPQRRVALCLRAAGWYAGLGHPEWGAMHIEKAQSLAPADARVARARARLLAAVGSEGLEAAHRRVLELDPVDATSLAALEAMARSRGSLEELVAFLEERVRDTASARLNPTRVAVARLQNELGRTERALAVLEEALAADRTDAAVLRALDPLYDGLPRDQLRILEGRLAHDPRDRTAVALRAARLLDEEFLDPDRAAGRLRDRITEEPEAADVYVALAAIEVKRRRFSPALATLELAVEVLSDPMAQADACLRAARLRLDEVNDASGAIELLERGRKLDAGNDAIVETLARAYDRAGDVPRALEALVGVAHRREEPSARAEALCFVATQYRTRLGDPQKARRLFTEALRHAPEHLGALADLHAIALERGELEEAAQYLDRQQRHTPNAPARARLLIELATLRRDRLDDTRGAEHAFYEALTIDPGNHLAGLSVAGAYFAQGRLDDAAEVLAELARGTRPPEAQRVVLAWQARVATARGDHALALDAFKRAVKLGEADWDVLWGLVESAASAGKPVDALPPLRRLLSSIPPEDVHTRVATLRRMGEMRLAAGDLRSATQDLEKALELDPNDRRTTEAVIAIAVRLGQWEHVRQWEGRLLQLVDDRDERRAILRAAADRWTREVKNPALALDALDGLIALDPSDRRVLHEILAQRQELRDFAGVAHTIERIVSLDPDRSRRAKYLITAARICRDELGDPERAMALFDRALDDDPEALEAFSALDALLTAARDFRRLERAYRKMIHRTRHRGDKALDLRLWHALGLIYRDRLGEADAAVEAFRMAARIEPGEGRIVAQIFESSDRAELAVDELCAAIARDPLDPTHHRALHALHLRRGDRDRAFVTAAALVALGAADDDTRALYQQERPKELPPYTSRLVEGSLSSLAHPELDPAVTGIFAVMARALRGERSPSSRERENPNAPSHPAAATFFRIATVLGVKPPTLQLRPDVAAPLLAVDGTTVMGGPVLASPSQVEVGFVVAKHLVTNDGAHAVRSAFPSKTELRALLSSAIAVGAGREMPLGVSLRDEDLRSLRTVVTRFSAASGRVDVDRWLQCSELTGLRAALLVSGDLAVAAAVVRSEPVVAGDLSPSEKLGDLISFAVSERHHELRRLLGIHLGLPESVGQIAVASPPT